ncbi:MAG TPA: hypothetical protein VK113_09605 [Gemmatimonadales bacterium]|jgi:hypothetical protein|nr:hypothetical protein [Gemmatimonadales bacterium]
MDFIRPVAITGRKRTDSWLARQSFEHAAQQIVFQEGLAWLIHDGSDFGLAGVA